MNKKKFSIAVILSQMTVIPLLIFSIVIMIFSFFWISVTIRSEVQDELCNLARSTALTFDYLYPGDYKLYTSDTKMLASKGDTILNQNYKLIDSLKEQTGADYTIFLGDTRIITTITAENGTRIIGTPANEKTVSTVLENGNSTFFSNIDVLGENFYAYYEPLRNSDGSVVGMIAVLMPVHKVLPLLLRAVLPVLIITVILVILTIMWTRKYSKDFVKITKQLTTSFEKTASGSLTNNVPTDLLARKDEFGDMAHSLSAMQSSLRALVEQDVLTGLLNRRFGYMKLDELLTKSLDHKKSFSIALGDIDFFKRFNDTYGHDCGDMVLREISSILKKYQKEYGYSIRWGGEEFLLALSNGTFEEHEKNMNAMLEHIRNTTFNYEGQEMHVTMTFGLIDTAGYEIVDDMVIRVDELLYYGKENGRNQLVTEESIPADKKEAMKKAQASAPSMARKLERK